MIVTANKYTSGVVGSNHINEIMHNHLLASPTQNIIVSSITELGICY